MSDPWFFSSYVSCNGGRIPCKFHQELQYLFHRYLQTIPHFQQVCWYLDEHLHQHLVRLRMLRYDFHRVSSHRMEQLHEGRDH